MVGTQGVDGEGKWGDVAVDRRAFKKEGLAAARFLHLPIGDFGDLQFGGDWRRDAPEFAVTLQFCQKGVKGVEGHNGRG